MAIRRISDNMMLNANNSFNYLAILSKEEVIGKTTLELLFTEQEKYRVDHIINQQMKSSRTLKLTYKKKKKFALISTSLLKLEIDNEPCLLIVALDITERKKATEDLKKQTKR
jgi:PAS domain S-box-containing protein